MIYIGIDPGLGGAVAVKNGNKVLVFDAPTKKKKNGKEDYDLLEMYDILHRFKGQPSILVLEDVHAMPGNGGVSMFNFGRGKGLWEMAAIAAGCTLVYVSPQTWKKDYIELCPPKAPKAPKDTTPKSAKEKKVIAQEAAKQKRLVKALAKEKARDLARSLCPYLEDRFKTVNSDGRAEAVLIAYYAEKHHKEQK